LSYDWRWAGISTETLTLFAHQEGFKKFNLGYTSALSFLFLAVVLTISLLYLAVLKPYGEIPMSVRVQERSCWVLGILSLLAGVHYFSALLGDVASFKPPAVNGGPTYLPFIDYQPTLKAWRAL
jgi:hypothetical protein